MSLESQQQKLSVYKKWISELGHARPEKLEDMEGRVESLMYFVKKLTEKVVVLEMRESQLCKKAESLNQRLLLIEAALGQSSGSGTDQPPTSKTSSSRSASAKATKKPSKKSS